MAKRPWGASGVGPILPSVQLSEEQRKDVLALFDDRPLVNPDSFLKGVERAIHMYLQATAVARQSSPSEVRRNLSRAIGAALKLNDRMNDLDGNSWQLLRQVAPEIDQRKSLETIVETLSKAQSVAGDYPKKGRLPEHQNLFLAAELRALFDKHAGLKATSARGGLFTSLLEVVMPLATKKRVTDLHSLAEIVVRTDIRAEQSDGVIEFDPMAKKSPKKTAISKVGRSK